MSHLYDDVEDTEDESSYADREYFSTTFPELIETDMWKGESY